MQLRLAVLIALAAVLLVPSAASARGAHQPAHLDFLGERVTPPHQAGHTTWRADRPLGVLWTYADPPADGFYRGSAAAPTTRPRTRTAREPSTPTTSHAPRSSMSATGAQTGSQRSRRRAYDAAARARPTCSARPTRQRRAVDAARRDAEPERRAGRAAGPVGLRPVLLARAHGLGAGRGAARVRARRSRVRALPGRADGPRDRRARAAGPVALRPTTRSSTASASRRG